jgi:hypothetical protein
MHCALEGTVKKLLELWFKSSNHKYQFYMDSKIKHIDNLLLKIQYPSELPRTQRSIINYNYKFSTNTDNKNFKTQNFTIRYLNSTSYKYGILRNFYNINNVIYALVQTFRKAQNFVSDQTIEEHLNKYFLICHLSEEYEIIHYKNIDTKCVILKNQNEYFISVCNLLNEHD